MCDLVPVDPLRERYEALERRGEINPTRLAARLGFVRRNPRTGEAVADSTRAARMVGVEPERTGKTRSRIKYDNAVALCRALDMDPFEAGV